MEHLTAEFIISAIRAEGMRLTEPRKKIIRVLLGTETPLSMQEILQKSQGKGSSPDFSTVFRVVTLLEKLGLAHKLEVGRPQPYYELSDRHNDHLVCTSCGKFFPVEHCPAPVATIEKAHDFKVDSHSLILFGRCSCCR